MSGALTMVFTSEGVPTAEPYSLLHGENLHNLETRIVSLEKEVEKLRKVALQQRETELVIIRTIPRQQAKEEILALFQSGEALDQAEVAERLSLSLSVVADLCEKLIQEGRITYSGNAD